MQAFDPVAPLQRYFKGWQQHDERAVLTAFSAAGTYQDPVTCGPISSEALAGYLRGLWTALPDLDVQIGAMRQNVVGTICCAWTVRGTHIGWCAGLTPTGRRVVLAGTTTIRIGPEGIARVTNSLDPDGSSHRTGLDLITQLGARLTRSGYEAPSVRPGIPSAVIGDSESGHQRRSQQVRRATALAGADVAVH